MKILYTIFIILIFGSNSYAMDKYFGSPSKIADWKISCSVDKGSIIDNYPSYVFKTSKNRCSGGTYTQRVPPKSDFIPRLRRGGTYTHLEVELIPRWKD